MSRIESLRVEVTPPAYAQGIGSYKGELPSEGVAGLAGTRVRLIAVSNRPLSGGVIAVTIAKQTAEYPMQLAAGKGDTVVGEFPITADGKFELRVRDVDEQSSRESIAAAITLLSDQRPFVRLMQPRSVSLATPSAHLPVEMAGEDDYGISRLELYRSLNDSRAMPLAIAVGQPAPRRQHEVVYLPLAEYGLQPGDQIKLFARIEDNDPHRAKGAESPVATVNIISQEEFERMLRAREGLNVLMSKYRQAQRMLESLREKAKGLQEKNGEKKGLVDKELREQSEELAKQLRKNAEALAKAAQHALPYDADASLTPQLEELAKQLEEAAKQLERQLQRLELEREQLAMDLDKLAGMLGKQSDLYNEAAMSPLEHLERVLPLLVGQSRFMQLVQRQRDLAMRLAAS